MYSYQVSTVRIRSSVAIPELSTAEAAAAEADVVIRDGDPPEPGAVPETGASVDTTDRRVSLAYADVGVFRIESGTRVDIAPLPGVTERTLRRYLVGPVLGILLAQRGSLVLHASTIATDHGAVAVLGATGQGKSTLAAMGVARGQSLVSDDVTAIDVGPEGVRVRPGLPLLKLESSVMAAIEAPFEAYPAVAGGKTHYDLSSAMVSAPRRLERIYLLDRGPSIEFERLSPSAALTTLVGNTYPKPLLEDAAALATNFEQCSTTADSVPVTRLRRPRRLSALETVLERIESDVAHGRPQ